MDLVHYKYFELHKVLLITPMFEEVAVSEGLATGMRGLIRVLIRVQCTCMQYLTKLGKELVLQRSVTQVFLVGSYLYVCYIQLSLLTGKMQTYS